MGPAMGMLIPPPLAPDCITFAISRISHRAHQHRFSLDVAQLSTTQGLNREMHGAEAIRGGDASLRLGTFLSRSVIDLTPASIGFSEGCRRLAEIYNWFTEAWTPPT